MIQHKNSTLRSARILCYISESFYAFTNSLPPPSTLFILVDETRLQHSRIFFMSLLCVNSRLFPMMGFYKGRVSYNCAICVSYLFKIDKRISVPKTSQTLACEELCPILREDPSDSHVCHYLIQFLARLNKTSL